MIINNIERKAYAGKAAIGVKQPVSRKNKEYIGTSFIGNAAMHLAVLTASFSITYGGLMLQDYMIAGKSAAQNIEQRIEGKESVSDDDPVSQTAMHGPMLIKAKDIMITPMQENISTHTIKEDKGSAIPVKPASEELSIDALVSPATKNVLTERYHSIIRNKHAMRSLQRKAERVSKYSPIINEAAEKYGIAPEILFALILHESAGYSDIVSSTGDVGLTQLQKKTAKSECKITVGKKFDGRKDPSLNIYCGAKYLGRALEALGSYEKALMGYNGGIERMDSLLESHKENIRNTWREIPETTKNYPYNVLGFVLAMRELNDPSEISYIPRNEKSREKPYNKKNNAQSAKNHNMTAGRDIPNLSALSY